MPETTQPFVETWQERIDRERTENKKKYKDLYSGVAEFLPGWRVEIIHDETYCVEECFALVNNVDAPLPHDLEGQHITLGFRSVGGARESKVHVSGSWPSRGPHAPFMAPSDVFEESPSIGCSLARGYKAVAKDIQKRFLPEYLRIWDKLQARIESDNAYANRKAANWQRLIDADVLIDPRERNGEYVARAHAAQGDYEKGYGDIRMTGVDSIQIELRSLPVDTAIRILRALKGE